MKVTVTVDCTPDEARSFLGLPDVKPLQEELLAEVAAAIRGNLKAMDPKSLLETWLPATVKGLEQWQEMFRKAVKKD
jgi:Family of unknown function (DUF6489)